MAQEKPYAKCSCGRVYQTREDWEKLPPAAGGLIYEDEVEIQEYRNCACHSTMAVVIEYKK